MSPTARAWLQIHFCVVLWGFTAILGKLITLAALQLVWWRMLLVSALLACWPPFWRRLRRTSRRDLFIFCGIGAGIAVHWVTFYAAIRLANASVAATCMALNPVFLAFVEPWLTKRAFSFAELALGLFVLPGVALVVGGVPDGMLPGVAMGVLSSAAIAVCSALNKRHAVGKDPLAVTFVEMTGGVVLLSLLGSVPSAPSVFVWPSAPDLGFLALLASLCTLLPYALSLVAMRELSAFSVTLAVNLEPIYAMGLAALLFAEQRELSALFYLGASIIVSSVFIAPWLTRARAPGAA